MKLYLKKLYLKELLFKELMPKNISLLVVPLIKKYFSKRVEIFLVLLKKIRQEIEKIKERKA